MSTPAERERRCVVCHATYAGSERFCPADGGAIVVAGEDATSQVGRTIDGRYLIRRLVGHGGMGAVYEADHVGLDRKVAIKFLLGDTTDRDMLARFRQEARTASKVVHDNVVQIYDVGQDDTGLDFLVMEYLEGRDLAHVIAEGPLAPERAGKITRQLLAGLGAIHARGIVHRDVKPANVLLVERDGDPDHVKVTDFGIAKPIDTKTPALTDTGKVVGTPQYMAPEQLAGEPSDHRADLYAAGLTLYEMLAGAPPFVSTASAQLAAMQLTQEPPPIPRSIPPALVTALDRALQKKPERRFADAQEFLAALDGHEPPARFSGPVTAVDRPALKTAADRPSAKALHDAAPATRRQLDPARSKWFLPVVVAGAVALPIVIYLAVRGSHAPSPEPQPPPPTPIAVAADAATGPTLAQHLAYAEAMENEGKPELAIAALEEAIKLDPRPALQMRLANLHERLGHRADAARYLRAYLAAAPTATDRAAVEAKIAALEAPPPVDAGVADATTPAVAPPIASRKKRKQKCHCVPNDIGKNRGMFLCSVKHTLMCRCEHRGIAVCPTFEKCADGCPGEPNAPYACTTKFLDEVIPGNERDACSGYEYPTGPLVTGALVCDAACSFKEQWVDGDGDDQLCSGFDIHNGGRGEGTTVSCIAP